MPVLFNQTILMSGVEYFDNKAAINPFMDATTSINISKAAAEHIAIKKAFLTAGIKVITIPPPADCQDGVYTANWGLERNGTVVLARLPNARKLEEPYAETELRKLGKSVVHLPKDLRFSGQGDALPCGDILFCGSGYRSDIAAQEFVADLLGFRRIQLQTVPVTDKTGKPITNRYSDWADSFFYDLDLAVSIIKPPVGETKGLIAWCPEAFLPQSQELLYAFEEVDKIEISLVEATKAFACNLVSTGETVIMNQGAPEFEAALRALGLKTVTLSNSELAMGGGSIRCTSLTLSNA